MNVAIIAGKRGIDEWFLESGLEKKAKELGISLKLLDAASKDLKSVICSIESQYNFRPDMILLVDTFLSHDGSLGNSLKDKGIEHAFFGKNDTAEYILAWVTEKVAV